MQGFLYTPGDIDDAVAKLRKLMFDKDFNKKVSSSGAIDHEIGRIHPRWNPLVCHTNPDPAHGTARHTVQRIHARILSWEIQLKPNIIAITLGSTKLREADSESWKSGAHMRASVHQAPNPAWVDLYVFFVARFNYIGGILVVYKVRHFLGAESNLVVLDLATLLQNKVKSSTFSGVNFRIERCTDDSSFSKRDAQSPAVA